MPACSTSWTASCLPELGFVTEHTVGHVTFERLLREAAAADGSVAASWFPLGFEPRGPVEALPGVRSNWSLRSSLRARALLARQRRPWDALLFHTQTASLLSAGLMRRIPTLVSVDATPRNFDEVAAGYGHSIGDPRVERAKARVVGRPLRAAAGVIAWSEWVRGSLIADYGVDPERIHLIPSGTRVPDGVPRRTPGDRLRLLFVGGQFERKGGPLLLDALAGADFPYELHVVTKSEVAARDGVTVHAGIDPGSPRLDELYARSDVFVLPTEADASPHVILEAMAAGLPVISTPTGAIAEMVGDTGELVPAGRAEPLREAIARLRDPARRERLGAAARARVEERFDARRNARAVIELMKTVSRAR
jgi:glycosyltransferase involved in cell wall biosynthesis